MVVRWRLRPLIGASCWKRKAKRLLRRKRLKYFVARIGDLFTDLSGDKVLHAKRRRIWSRIFLRVCSNTETWTAVRREKGRLRSYLLVSLKRFLASEQHRASGVKRYESGPHIPLDELLESEVADLELTETWSADRLYERNWALAVLEQVLGRLESEYQAAGNAALFDRLKEFLVGERGTANTSRDRHRIGHDRERGEAGVSSASPALPRAVT